MIRGLPLEVNPFELQKLMNVELKKVFSVPGTQNDLGEEESFLVKARVIGKYNRLFKLSKELETTKRELDDVMFTNQRDEVKKEKKVGCCGCRNKGDAEQYYTTRIVELKAEMNE